MVEIQNQYLQTIFVKEKVNKLNDYHFFPQTSFHYLKIITTPNLVDRSLDLTIHNVIDQGNSDY